MRSAGDREPHRAPRRRFPRSFTRARRLASAILVASAALVALAIGAAACGGGNGSGDKPAPPARPLPDLGDIVGTDREMIVPTHTRGRLPDPRKPNDPTALAAMRAEHWGDFTRGPGEAATDRTPDGASPPAPGAGRRRVARFVHISDFQLADDESPARVVALDEPFLTDGAFRPQEGYGCRVVDAVVKTINRIHRQVPFDFVLLGGDNADNTQQNELDWVFSILGGASSLACDSGAKDDPVPGPNNDGKDPFTPEGLDVPWLWVTGNHDVEQQGNYDVTPDRVALSTSNDASGGTRDYSLAGGPVTQTTVIPDAKRQLLTRAEVMNKIIADSGKSGPPGHGLGEYARARHKAFYTYDLPGSPIRFLVIDTSAETGGATGVIHQSDVDAFVAPELARAEADAKWLVLASHHASDSIGDGSDTPGVAQPDAVTTKDWEARLTANPRVILDVVGHAHDHRVRRIGTAAAGYWEVQSDAIADYPHQLRVIEIWDEDNGWISIRSVVVDYATDEDGVAATARELGILDYTVGWSCCGPGTAADRNVVLWQKKP